MRGGRVCIAKIFACAGPIPSSRQQKNQRASGSKPRRGTRRKNSGRRVGAYRRELFLRRINPTWRLEHAALVQASDGNLYGTAALGGSANKGVVFKLAVGLPSSSPTVAISLDNASITLGGSATLTWSSSNVTSCAASNEWTGSQSTSGTQSVTPVAVGTFTYTLTCSGSGGSANGSATLTVTPVGGGGSSGGGGGGGCAMNPSRGFDAMLPLLLIAALGWIARRRGN